MKKISLADCKSSIDKNATFMGMNTPLLEEKSSPIQEKTEDYMQALT